MDIIPPLRWNVVESGLSRGGYPVLRNFRHLSRTRLKTIVSLIPELPSTDLVEFAKITGIELVYISVNRSLPLGHSLLPSLVQALNVSEAHVEKWETSFIPLVTLTYVCLFEFVDMWTTDLHR